MPKALEAPGDSKDEDGGGRKSKLSRRSSDPENPTGKKTNAGLQGDHKKLMLLLMKMMLQAHQSRRSLEGILLDTFILPADSQEVTSISEQTLAYDKKVKAAGRGHSLGSPHLYAWMGLISSLVKRGEKIGSATAERIAGYKAKMEEQSLEELADEVRLCKVDKVYSENMKRLTMSVERSGIRLDVIKALTELKAVRKQGRAPAGHMERELQQWLEAFLAK